MWPDRVSNPGPPTYESGALLTALRGPAEKDVKSQVVHPSFYSMVSKIDNTQKCLPVK